MLSLFTLKAKLIIAVVLAVALIGAGIWFRGVLAANTRMKTEIAAVTAEVERMGQQDASDYALFQSAEQRQAKLAKELTQKQRELRKAEEKLNDATRNCFDLVLPAAYLERLPQAAH